MALTKLPSIVSADDMTGKFTLVIGSDTTKFDKFIIDNEYEILMNMLGAELYNTYATTPTNINWIALRDGESYTDYNSNIRNWQGLKNMLVPYHYSSWIIENKNQQDVTFMGKTDHENASRISDYNLEIVSNKAFNVFLGFYNNAYDFMFSKNSSDTTKYNEFYLWFTKKISKSMFKILSA